MATPRDKDARRFYLAGHHRRLDAEYLLEGGRTTAWVYLGGYCVECLLKALLLMQVPKSKRKDIAEEFRGTGAHNFDRLRSLYLKVGGSAFPKDVIEAFLVVRAWSTDWRYEPALTPADDAERFLAAVETIRAWADSRM